jgi:adenosylcobinamide kinase/adenosylcobinamide-phosphate guanylyltransferase
MAEMARSELVLGGQRSGKSRRAESLAQRWLADSTARRAVLLVTGEPGDAEMRERIARHQADRARRAPGLTTVEAPLALADALRHHSEAQTLVVVDCLTLWLTRLMMPLDPGQTWDEPAVNAASEALCQAIADAPGPVVLVGNEIGLGVIPIGSEVRRFVDALGRLNQRMAARCERVTLMVAGLPLTLKEGR